MKRFIFPISVALLLVVPRISAQTLVHDSLYASLGVSAVRTVITQNGDTTVRQLDRYNRNGYKIAFHYSTPPGKYNVDVHDTFIIRGADYYTCIDYGDRRLYDSSHTIHTAGYSDTIRTSFYKNGKVVIQYVTIPTKEKDKTHHLYFEKRRNETVYTETRKFDNKGRLREKELSDSIFQGKKREEKYKYRYVYTYNTDFRIQSVYKTRGDTSHLSYTTYTSANGSYDSTIRYTDKGNADYSFVIYRDEQGRDTLSVTCNASGVITNRNVSVYTAGYAKTEHADGSGSVFKTHEWFLNDNGLVVKEMETDHKSGVVRTIYYGYSYY